MSECACVCERERETSFQQKNTHIISYEERKKKRQAGTEETQKDARSFPFSRLTQQNQLGHA